MTRPSLTSCSAPHFDYFWYETNPANGLIKDRSSDPSLSSIAAVGFGLSALTVGIDRGWINRETGRTRALTTLEFLWNSPQGPEPDATGYKGFYYHFLDLQTGRRDGDSELSTVDTALLLAGVLHVQQYFDQHDASETKIRALADNVYHRVEWPWMQVRSARICHGWTPETGFLPYDWGGYNEAMILYLLALGSPPFPSMPRPGPHGRVPMSGKPTMARRSSSFLPSSDISTRTSGSTFAAFRTLICVTRGSIISRTPAAPLWPTAPMRLPIPMVGLIMAKTCGA